MSTQTQKARNVFFYFFISFVIIGSLFAANNLHTNPEPAIASAHEFSIEEQIKQNEKAQKISELETELKKQKSITLTSQKREGEIDLMISSLKSGQCTDIDNPENCLNQEGEKTGTGTGTENPKVQGVK